MAIFQDLIKRGIVASEGGIQVVDEVVMGMIRYIDWQLNQSLPSESDELASQRLRERCEFVGNAARALLLIERTLGHGAADYRYPLLRGLRENLARGKSSSDINSALILPWGQTRSTLDKAKQAKVDPTVIQDTVNALAGLGFSDL
uniref:Uncharacterized protein n=1 Tax=Lotharella globosa TaxID=91324 RepID=A0A7S4DN30_9EUKA